MSIPQDVPRVEVVPEQNVQTTLPARGGRALPYGVIAALVLAGVAVWFYDAIRPRIGVTAAGDVTPASLPVVDVGHVRTTFRASGATFPYPLYARLFADYNQLRPGVKVEYAAIGSGAGIAEFAAGRTDFGASDAPMTDDQMRGATGGGEVLHVPLTLSAVVPVYRLPGVAADRPLVFSGPVLADVFRGAITRWDDPALAALNPGVALPAGPITVVHRADGSGTTYVFADYLGKVSAGFAAAVGAPATDVAWPAPRKAAAHGSEGVVAAVAATPGAIGYVELTHALRNGVSFGSVVNAAGRPVHATLASVSAAAEGLPTPPADLRMSITNAPGEGAYPIAAFSYLLIRRDQPDREKAHALADFLTWAVTDGQRLAPALQYAPLPSDVTALTQRIIQTIRVNGRHFASAQ